MVCHVHHVHIFASHIEKTGAFYKEFFGSRVILDEELAGARNVFRKDNKGQVSTIYNALNIQKSFL